MPTASSVQGKSLGLTNTVWSNFGVILLRGYSQSSSPQSKLSLIPTYVYLFKDDGGTLAFLTVITNTFVSPKYLTKILRRTHFSLTNDSISLGLEGKLSLTFHLFNLTTGEYAYGSYCPLMKGYQVY